MSQKKGILLDIPYTLSLMHPSHRAIVTTDWGPQYWSWIYPDAPRLKDINELKKQALWALLLYDKVLFPNVTRELYTEARAEPKPLSPELDDLTKLSEMGVAGLVDPPKAEPLWDVSIDSQFAQTMKEFVRADLKRDGETINDWEYDYLVNFIGTEQKAALENLLREEIEPLRNQLFPIIEIEVPPKLTIEEVIAKVPADFFEKKIVMPSKRFYNKLREILSSMDTEHQLRNYTDEQLHSLSDKLSGISMTCDRLKRLLLTSGHHRVDLKIDSIIPKTPSKSSQLSRIEGDNLYQVVSIFLDEVPFPDLRTIRDVRQHLGKKYVVDLRETIFEWSEAVNIGSINEEKHLRCKVREAISLTAKKVGIWKKVSFGLGIIQKIAEVGAMIQIANLIAAPIALGAGIAKDLTDARAGKIKEKRAWLLYGHDF